MKSAIVFSVENKRDGISPDESSTFEKMSIALAHSIRQHMPDIDIYCGSFTNNSVSPLARGYFEKFNVNVVQDCIFNDVGNDDSYMFLRSFTKYYFGNLLLARYDYLVYVDIDVLALAPFEFSFDASGPIAVIDTMPPWVTDFLKEYMHDLSVPLLYNWFDIVNKHNLHIFDMDYTDKNILHKHTADIIVSERLHASDLTLIEQTMGGYHCVKPLTKDSLAYHYDSLGYAGTLYHLETTHPKVYTQYKTFFERILNVPVINQVGYWENVRDEYQRSKV